MHGLAQALFMERENRPIDKGHKRPAHPISWPFLEKLLKNKQLAYTDYAMAERLLRREQNPREDIAAVICHLSLAARSGHLCIAVEGKQILPDPMQLWSRGVDSKPLEENDLGNLVNLIRSGFNHLPSSIVTDASSTHKGIPLTPLCRVSNLLYLQRNWVYESMFVKHREKINNSVPALQIDQSKLTLELQSLIEQKRLLPEQAESIRHASQQSLTIITGGPGTGKTYTAGWLVKLFWNNLSEEQRKKCELALAAPTGKAAANLQHSLKKALEGVEINMESPKTLHALLGIKSSKNSNFPKVQLSADIVLVDESSMIDVRLMAHLFASIKPGARLILLGDRYQLPPVEAGSLFSDLIEQRRQSCGELKQCLRAELQEIIELAAAINVGEAEKALSILAESKKGVKRLTLDGDPENTKQMQRLLVNYSENLFPQHIESIDSPKELLEAFNRFRILTPLRQGPYGVDELNRLFFIHAVKKAHKGSHCITPIMIVRNDYKQNLLNGETGVLVTRARGNEMADHLQEGDYAYFPGHTDDEPFRKIPALLLPKYEYAYCLSVHKSQGSEFEKVLLLNPKGSESFGREVLYTGVTRARKQLEIWSPDETLRETIARKSHRLSGLIGWER